MRSLLIAPADEKRLAEALKSGADAIIVDLVRATPAERAAARAVAARFLKETRGPGREGRRSSSGQMRSIRARPIPISTR